MTIYVFLAYVQIEKCMRLQFYFETMSAMNRIATFELNIVPILESRIFNYISNGMPINGQRREATGLELLNHPIILDASQNSNVKSNQIFY